MRIRLYYFLLLLIALGSNALASSPDQLIETAKDPRGEIIPYMLTGQSPNPNYAVILMPGGTGQLEPHRREGQLVFKASGNFLIRSRGVFADEEFVAVSTDATGDPVRMTAIVQDLSKRYPGIAVYIIGTSRSTLATMGLSGPMDGKVTGFVHTSSMETIGGFNTRAFKSRHLIVHHKSDGCHRTKFYWAELNHKKFGTELISMDGGVSTGDPCAAFAYHGYNGIEKETIDRIKAWIKAD